MKKIVLKDNMELKTPNQKQRCEKTKKTMMKI